jgi:hypothetical protein
MQIRTADGAGGQAYYGVGRLLYPRIFYVVEPDVPFAVKDGCFHSLMPLSEIGEIFFYEVGQIREEGPELLEAPALRVAAVGI